MRMPVAAALALVASAAGAQDLGQTGRRTSFELTADALLRQEWTRGLTATPDASRWRAQVRPRLEVGFWRVLLGVGADLSHGSDDNTLAPTPPLRDNFESRGSRLDLAFLSLRPLRWLRLQGGRFPMPVALTEMLWDRDLRPQGAALTLGGTDQRLALTVLGARGSHVFGDEDTEMLLASAELRLPAGIASTVELAASFLAFDDADALDPLIRRQNTRLSAGGPLPPEHRILDLVVRLRHEGPMQIQLVADGCWNTSVDTANRGLWLAVALGSLRTARGRLEYTFARVDRDATVAAYATDDFLWGTGWEGHRADLGLRVSDRASAHLVAQRQRFKDSPQAEERERWATRYRLELRFNY